MTAGREPRGTRRERIVHGHRAQPHHARNGPHRHRCRTHPGQGGGPATRRSGPLVAPPPDRSRHRQGAAAAGGRPARGRRRIPHARGAVPGDQHPHLRHFLDAAHGGRRSIPVLAGCRGAAERGGDGQGLTLPVGHGAHRFPKAQPPLRRFPRRVHHRRHGRRGARPAEGRLDQRHRLPRRRRLLGGDRDQGAGRLDGGRARRPLHGRLREQGGFHVRVRQPTSGGARPRDHGRGGDRVLSVHPVLADGRRLAVYMTASLPVALAGTALLAQSRNALPPAPAALIAFPLSVAATLLLLPVWYLCRALPVYETSLSRLVLTHAGGALLTGLAARYLGGSVARLASSTRPGAGIESSYEAQSAGVMAAGALVYLLAVSFHYVLLGVEATRRAEQHSMELSILAREAELRAPPAHQRGESVRSRRAAAARSGSRAHQRPPPPARGLRRPRAVRGRAWRGLLPGGDLDARGDGRVIRVLIVDDEAPARAILREMLSAEPDVEVLGEAATGLEAVKTAAELK